jgi:hypothetical protein
MIDTFYRIKALHSHGIEVHLHCFTYGRKRSPELESLCRSVKYYERERGIIQHLSRIPYIVATRKSDRLLEELCKNDYPILFDGIHTTWLLNSPALTKRKKIVRMHNIEHDYYKTLAKNEPGIFRKLYYSAESNKLKMYESVLSAADHILTVSQSDNDHFSRHYGNSILMPSSHPFGNVEIPEGSGTYIVFHGDLSVNENSAVADFLLREVFSKIDYPSVIAGKNPPVWLRKKIPSSGKTILVADPDNQEMKKLIREAQINILPVIKMNGLKLKLIYALYSGRHLLVNTEMAKGLRPGNLYHLADEAGEMIAAINRLMMQPFTAEMIEERKKFLSSSYDSNVNAKKICELI